MAIPTHVGTGAAESGVGATSPSWPAGHQVDDIGLIVIENEAADAAPGAIAGWVDVTGSPIADAARSRLSVRWKRATSGAEADVAVPDSGNHALDAVMTFRGCPTTGDPWDFIATATKGSGSTELAIVGGETTVADCLVVAIASSQIATSVNDGTWANADLSDLADILDASTAAGTDGSIHAACGGKAVAGVFGETTATLAGSAANAELVIALKPAAGGAPNVNATSSVSAGGGPTSTGTKATSAASTSAGGARTTATAVKGASGVSTATAGAHATATSDKGASSSSTATTGAAVTAISGKGGLAASLVSAGAFAASLARKGIAAVSAIAAGARVQSTGTAGDPPPAKSGTSSVSAGGRLTAATAKGGVTASQAAAGAQASSSGTKHGVAASVVRAGGALIAFGRKAAQAASDVRAGASLTAAWRKAVAGTSSASAGARVTSTPAGPPIIPARVALIDSAKTSLTLADHAKVATFLSDLPKPHDLAEMP